MKIQQVTLNNFMPYKGEQTIQFPQHEHQNVLLLFGDNMRGKTSFLNAIRWGLYGTALARHLRVIPRMNLVNIDAASAGDWSMAIDLAFSHDGCSYELKRGISLKQHRSEPSKDADFEETLHLSIDGDVQSGDLLTSRINQIIPDEISRFFLFDGELLQEYENLLIEGSEDGEKIKGHIEQILGVPALLNGRYDLGRLLQQARNKQAQDAKKSSALKGHADRHKQLDVKRESSEKDKVDLELQRESIQSEIDTLDDFLKNTEAVQRKKTELEKLKMEKKSIDIQLTQLADELRRLLRDAWKDILVSRTSSMVDQFTRQRDNLQDALSNKSRLNHRILELQESLTEAFCNMCQQPIPEEKNLQINRELKQLQAEAALSEVDPSTIMHLNSDIDKLSRVRSSNEGQRIVEAVAKNRRLQVELIRIESKLDEIHEEIESHDTDAIMRHRDKRDQFNKQLGKLEQDIEKTKGDLDKITENQAHIATLISRDKGSQGQLSSIRLKYCEELTEIFSTGIERLREALRVDVEAAASHTFMELTTESEYSGLEINQNYGLSILDSEGRKLAERSAGAEQIVALSLIDGLNKTAKKSVPIIMDTPLGRLDPKHRRNVLKYLPNMAEQVILLVHEGEINPNNDLDNFASRIGARYQINRVSDTQSQIERCE